MSWLFRLYVRLYLIHPYYSIRLYRGRPPCLRGSARPISHLCVPPPAPAAAVPLPHPCISPPRPRSGAGIPRPSPLSVDGRRVLHDRPSPTVSRLHPYPENLVCAATPPSEISSWLLTSPSRASLHHRRLRPDKRAPRHHELRRLPHLRGLLPCARPQAHSGTAPDAPSPCPRASRRRAAPCTPTSRASKSWSN
jgi:hypothetical protein